MDRPLVGRCLGAVEIVAVEILHDQPVASDAAGANISDCDKCVGARHAYADMAVTVGNALVIEDVAGGYQFLGQLFELR